MVEENRRVKITFPKCMNEIDPCCSSSVPKSYQCTRNFVMRKISQLHAPKKPLRNSRSRNRWPATNRTIEVRNSGMCLAVEAILEFFDDHVTPYMDDVGSDAIFTAQIRILVRRDLSKAHYAN